jgi:FHA domain
MAICPAGHTSTADDFCDNCGLLISAPSQAQQPADPWATAAPARQEGFGPGGSPAGGSGTPGAGVTGSGCPNCGTPRTGRFCEGCGLDYNSGKLPGGGPPLSPPTVFSPVAGSSPAGQGWPAPSPSAWQESSGPVQSPAQSAWGSSGPQEPVPQPAPDPFEGHPPTQLAANPYAQESAAQQSPAPQAPDAFNWYPVTEASRPAGAGPQPSVPSAAPADPSAAQGAYQPGAAYQPGPSPAPATPYAQPDPAGQPPWGAPGAPQAPFGQQAGLDPQYQSGAAQSAGYPGTAAPPAWTPGQASGSWSAVVSTDRTYYDIVRQASGSGAQGIDFPVYAAERRFSLVGAQMRIGRHSASRGLYPEIDLTGPPTDPGISRLHAVLIARPDGGWAVLDPGSANGTMVNGSEIPANQQVPLRDGDRINLGAWTAITVHYA